MGRTKPERSTHQTSATIMKHLEASDCVHVLNSSSVDLWKVARDVAAVSTATDRDEAFYVCDIGDVIKKLQNWQKLMPRIHPYYAVKCNDSQIVLEVLAALGTGFDCASKVEIDKILALGVHPDKIVFAHTAKPSSHIRHAAEKNVPQMTFDSEHELHKIKKFHPNSKLIIRIRCDSELAQLQFGKKFGCDPIHEAPRLLKCAKELGLNVIGVSFHVGSVCVDPPVFRKAIKAAKDVFELSKTLGFSFKLLDIGGGYPGNTGTSIDDIADVVNKALNDFFPDPEISVISEPGRYFVESAYIIVCNVDTKREIFDPKDGMLKHTMYFLNEGIYGAFNIMVYPDRPVKPIPFKENPTEDLRPSCLWGHTCNSLDQIAKDIMLPDLSIGDWIGFGDAGAYTMTVATVFNGFTLPKIYTVASQEIWKMLKGLPPLTEERFQHGTFTASVQNGIPSSKPLETISRDILVNIRE